MSETMARTGTVSTRDRDPASRRGRLAGWATPVNVVITAATLVGFGLRLYYQYTRPGFLTGVTEYDDGPYFGSSVLLVHGVVPYRDYVFVQPPGITLLMAPLGLLATVTGTSVALATGRLLTIVAGAVSVLLAGRLVRHRGLLPTLLTCGILAVYPDSVAAAHTVLVEPWLVLFCLMGALALFEGDRLTTSGKRLAWGGLAFGFAGAVEAWAIVPVLVIAALSLPHWGRGLRFAAGVACGFLIPVLPFTFLGPRQFYQSLITAQIGSRAHVHRVRIWNRLYNMTGLPQGHVFAHWIIAATTAGLVLLVIAGYLGASALTRRWPPPLDWFAVATAALVGLMFLWPPQFHYHFSAFLGPFLAITLGLSLARLGEGFSARPAAAAGRAEKPAALAAPGTPRSGGSHRASRNRARPWRARLPVVLATLALAAMAVIQARSEAVAPPVIGPIPPAVQRIIPPGACVVTDQIALNIAANRLVSTVPGCPYVVDGLGADLALSHGLSPGTGAGQNPAVAALWANAFAHAQYVLLSWASDRRVPWTPALQAYLATHFTQVFEYQGRITVYARKAGA